MFALTWCVAGCSSADDSAPHCSSTADTPALDATKKLALLTTAEKTTLCDWGACYLGGYGTTLSCANGTAASVAHDQQTCLQQSSVSSSCEATVQDQIDCIQAVHANSCEATLFGDGSCSRLLDCVL